MKIKKTEKLILILNLWKKIHSKHIYPAQKIVGNSIKGKVKYFISTNFLSKRDMLLKY